MSFPNHPDKYGKEPVFEPRHFIEYMKEQGWSPDYPVPEGVILCFHRRLFNHIKEKHETVVYDSAVGSLMLLPETKGIGVVPPDGIGIGAPGAVTRLQEYIALVCKRFIAIGIAGSLQKDVEIGSLVVCEKAIRDEGTSHHYVAPAKYAAASEGLTGKIKKALDEQEAKYHVGTSWTVDAPYRETVEEARQYQKEGVATVEMEAAALFAVAEYRKVEMGALFSISDSLADLKWKPAFHSQKTQKGLEFLYEVAVSALK